MFRPDTLHPPQGSTSHPDTDGHTAGGLPFWFPLRCDVFAPLPRTSVFQAVGGLELYGQPLALAKPLAHPPFSRRSDLAPAR